MQASIFGSIEPVWKWPSAIQLLASASVMERIGRCCVQVVTRPGDHTPDGLVPFCLWNLTSASGERLYPR